MKLKADSVTDFFTAIYISGLKVYLKQTPSKISKICSKLIIKTHESHELTEI